jgi:glutaminase
MYLQLAPALLQGYCALQYSTSQLALTYVHVACVCYCRSWKQAVSVHKQQRAAVTSMLTAAMYINTVNLVQQQLMMTMLLRIILTRMHQQQLLNGTVTLVRVNMHADFAYTII